MNDRVNLIARNFLLAAIGENDSEGTELRPAEVILDEEDSGSHEVLLPRTALKTVVPRIQVMYPGHFQNQGATEPHSCRWPWGHKASTLENVE